MKKIFFQVPCTILWLRKTPVSYAITRDALFPEYMSVDTRVSWESGLESKWEWTVARNSQK